MSEDVYNGIVTMLDNIDQHYALVEERMREAGIEPDPGLTSSMAKYWDALELLAGE